MPLHLCTLPLRHTTIPLHHISSHVTISSHHFNTKLPRHYSKPFHNPNPCPTVYCCIKALTYRTLFAKSKYHVVASLKRVERGISSVWWHLKKEAVLDSFHRIITWLSLDPTPGKNPPLGFTPLSETRFKNKLLQLRKAERRNRWNQFLKCKLSLRSSCSNAYGSVSQKWRDDWPKISSWKIRLKVSLVTDLSKNWRGLKIHAH